jgi:hypothetical protein
MLMLYWQKWKMEHLEKKEALISTPGMILIPSLQPDCIASVMPAIVS